MLLDSLSLLVNVFKRTGLGALDLSENGGIRVQNVGKKSRSRDGSLYLLLRFMCCWAPLRPDSKDALRPVEAGMGNGCCSEAHIFSGAEAGLRHSTDSSWAWKFALRAINAEEVVGCLSESGGVGNMVEGVLPEHWRMGGEDSMSLCSDPECAGVGIPPHSDSTESASDWLHTAGAAGDDSVSLAAGETWLSSSSVSVKDSADTLSTCCGQRY